MEDWPTFRVLPIVVPPAGPTFSYAGGQVLAGLIDGALAGQMGKQSMQALKYQIDESLALYDAGVRRGQYQIGWLTFDNHHTLDSQLARLRSASTQLATLAA